MLLYQDDVENSKVHSEWNRRKDSYNNNDDTLFSLFGFWDVTTEDCLISALVAGLLGWFYIKYKREAEYRECQNRLAAIYAQSQQRRFNQQSCPICLEDFPNNSIGSRSESSESSNNNSSNNNVRPTSLLACGHKFCTGCLDEWFGSRSRTEHRCPVCRHHRDDLSNVPADADNPQNENEEKKDNENTNNNENNNEGENENKNDNTEHDEKKTDNDSDNDGDRRRDYRDNQSPFTQDFPNVDKNQNGQSTFYGPNQGSNGTSSYGQSEQEDSQTRQRRRNDNRFWRRYAAMNIADDLMYRNELNFRLRRMRHFYPRYINDDMVNRWSRPGYNGGNFAQDSGFRANNPTPPQSSHSGASRRSTWGSRRSGGSSFSFGGGSSFGGGGGGGRW